MGTGKVGHAFAFVGRAFSERDCKLTRTGVFCAGVVSLLNHTARHALCSAGAGTCQLWPVVRRVDVRSRASAMNLSSSLALTLDTNLAILILGSRCSSLY
jgi:hypothetical protein